MSELTEPVEPEPIAPLTLVCPSDPLKTAIASLRALSDDAVMVFTEEGLTAKVVDSAHVCLLEISIPSKTFVSHTIPVQTEIAVPLDNLESALKIAGKKDNIKLTLTEENTYLTIEVGDIVKSVRLLDSSLVKNPPAPIIPFDLSYTLDADALKKAITASKTVGDVITLHYDGSTTTIKVDSNMERVEALLETSNPTITSKVSITSLYTVKYLVQMVKKVGSELVISWGDNKPLKMFSDDGFLTLSWLLAPRQSA
jgi:DNA polymerase III sliding clamp (beta) subunit (PCNA family)